MADLHSRRAPPISGAVPSDYQGQVFYRTRVVEYQYFKKPLFRRLQLANRDLGRRMANADPVRVAHRVDPFLFGPDRQLLDIFRQPIQAVLPSSAPKTLPEWGTGHISVVCERVRDAIENLQPRKHLFIPMDVATPEGSRRLYVFYVLRDHVQTVLALEANGIEYTRNEKGNPVFGTPPWLQSDRFAYLAAPVVEGVTVDHDAKVGIIMSKALVDDLGDVFPNGIDLLPMGVVDEPRTLEQWVPSREVMNRLSHGA